MTERRSIGLFAVLFLGSACGASSERPSRAALARPQPSARSELPSPLLSSVGEARWITDEPGRERQLGVSTLRPRPSRVASIEATPARLIAIEDDGVPHVSIDASAIESAELRRRMASGLPQRLVVHVAALDPRDMRVIGRGSQSCRVVHDPWGQRFEVSVTRGASVDAGTMLRFDEVVAACLRASDVPVGNASVWVGPTAREAAYAVWVELSPPSEGAEPRECAELTFRLAAEESDVLSLRAADEPTCGAAPHHPPQ